MRRSLLRRGYRQTSVPEGNTRSLTSAPEATCPQRFQVVRCVVIFLGAMPVAATYAADKDVRAVQ
jgi:hypothetical protein